MDEHSLLTRIKSEIEHDLAPVRPLAPPGLRALWLLATWVGLAAFVLLAFGPRQDIGILEPWRSAGFSLVEVAFCVGLLALALRYSIPAMTGSPSMGLGWVAGALAVHVILSWATREASALAPPVGHEWGTGLACLGAITALSLAPLAVGASLLARGLLTQLIPAVLLTGLASGLAAEATWRLHCAYSTWAHVLPFHSGALVLPLLVAALGGIVVGRRV